MSAIGSRSCIRSALALIAVMALPAAASAGEPASFAALKLTHRLTAQVELVNHWTARSSGADCGFEGTGTLTVNGHMAPARAVAPTIDPFSHEWRVWVPYGYRNSLKRDMPLVGAAGTINRENNATQNPPGELGSCTPAQTGCGPVALRKPRINVVGHGRRNVIVVFHTRDFQSSKCPTGTVRSFDDLLVRMPRRSALRRKVLKLRAKGHEVTEDLGGDGTTTFTNDVTRTVTLTFRRR